MQHHSTHKKNSDYVAYNAEHVSAVGENDRLYDVTFSNNTARTLIQCFL